jgi:hypothetical protein
MNTWREALTDTALSDAHAKIMNLAGMCRMTSEFEKFFNWWNHPERQNRLLNKNRDSSGFGVLSNLSESANAALKTDGPISTFVAAKRDLASALETWTQYHRDAAPGAGPTRKGLIQRQQARLASSVHETVAVHVDLIAKACEAPAVSAQPLAPPLAPPCAVLTQYDTHRSDERVTQPRVRRNGTRANTRTTPIVNIRERLAVAAEHLMSRRNFIEGFTRTFQEQRHGCAGAAVLCSVSFTMMSATHASVRYTVSISANPKCSCPDFCANGTSNRMRKCLSHAS